MYILCSKEEYRSLVAGCAKAHKLKRNLLNCKGCLLNGMCEPRSLPGDMLSATCIIFPEGQDSFTSIDEDALGGAVE